MIKIHCFTCSCIGLSSCDGTSCEYRDIEYLDEKLDIDLGFCNEYSYNYCLDCEEYYNSNFDCALCNKK